MATAQAKDASAGSERRKSRRHPTAEHAPVTVTSGGKVYTCYVEDISLNGIRLRFQDDVPDSNVIALDHPVAGTLCGSCVWRKPGELGVELVFPKAGLERALRCICLVL